ncbi:MAG: aspartate--tRNA ligase [Flavobacteriales bacterium]|nr:MAG: aspartate--tRNA ligase [Flavobacteriales bacterium]
MFRTHHNGELSLQNLNQEVTLSGWVQTIRDKGFMIWIDLRDRYGITQLVLDEERTPKSLLEKARTLGREFVIQIQGQVIERSSKNPNIPTGEIEILVSELNILNESEVPPFTIENETDGGEELRMKYRYLDLRRNPVKDKLIFRSQMAQKVRNYLSNDGFIEVETPVLIKSTPEGARDFVVPSRMNEGQFYALPQSPQTFKQLMMIGGLDKYFQIVKCFRDEDLRADRQPEFTQIDCEMAFVEQEDIMNVFEGMTAHLLKEVTGQSFDQFPRISFEEAMRKYGNDKPDIRFGMEFVELNEVVKGKDFKIFDDAELVVGINVEGCANYTRKQIDKLIKWVKRPQIAASGMIWVKYQEDGTLTSSVNKFYNEESLQQIAEKFGAKAGDLMLLMSGNTNTVRTQLSALRMELAEQLGLRKPDEFAPLWVVDFPLLEWDEETESEAQFGFLMNAFKYGAPPHGGIAFGFDRLVSILDGSETIRDYIAFPKNNSGRDVMIDAPSPLSDEQLEELNLNINIQ